MWQAKEESKRPKMNFLVDASGKFPEKVNHETNLRLKVDENLNCFCDNQPSELREYDEYKKSAIGLMSSFVQRSQPTNLFLISILSKTQLRILTFRQN